MALNVALQRAWSMALITPAVAGFPLRRVVG